MNHTMRLQNGSSFLTLFRPDEVAVPSFQSIDQDILPGTEAVGYGHEVDPLCSFFHGHPTLQRGKIHDLIQEILIFHHRAVQFG